MLAVSPTKFVTVSVVVAVTVEPVLLRSDAVIMTWPKATAVASPLLVPIVTLVKSDEVQVAIAVTSCDELSVKVPSALNDTVLFGGLIDGINGFCGVKVIETSAGGPIVNE